MVSRTAPKKICCVDPHLELEQVLELEGLKKEDVKVLSDTEIAKMRETPLEEVKAGKAAQINDATNAAIIAGFFFSFNGEELRFSYDVYDQQNFADTANWILLNMLNKQETDCLFILWNGWRKSGNEKGESVRLELSAEQFVTLYKEALAHKTKHLELAAQRKKAVKNAQSQEELDAI